MELNPSDSKSLVPGEAVPAGLPAPNENLPPLVRGWMQMPKNRQIGLVALLALTVALAIAALLWANRTEYATLFTELPQKEAGDIVETLEKLNVEHKIHPDTGAIQVPADQVHSLRLKLASMGLPKESTAGFELMEKESGFGVSQLVEGARYQRALEGEIARSIATIKSVKAARVHLALPKESVFVRQPKKASASVVVELHPGRSLEQEQVDAIVHLVASSVTQLEPNRITVVDQRGRLLFGREPDGDMELTAKQFAHKREMEEHLIDRVENILSPVAGKDGLRTQVTADIDFTVTERTQELFNPDLPALRSEQTSEEQNRGGDPQGVPGALTNQPPPAGVAPELAGQGQNGAAEQETKTSKSATRNYELDKTISHSRFGTGVLRRVTVAVVMDHRHVPQPDGSETLQPYSEEDLTRFTDLVKQAVGFDAARGDRVTVTNAAFRAEADAPGLQVWEQPWFWPLIKQVGAWLVVILLVLGVLRPAVKGLIGNAQAEAEAEARAREAAEAAAAREGELAEPEGTAEGEMPLLGQDEEDELLLLEAPQSHDKRLEFVQKAIDQDPKRVAQVIKNWMSVNNG